MTKDDAVPVTAELLPCPFCGGPAKADNEESEDVGGYFVSCTECPVSAWGDGRPEAITAWNARHRGSTAGVEPCGVCGHGLTTQIGASLQAKADGAAEWMRRAAAAEVGAIQSREAFQKIATGKIDGEPNNAKDTLGIVRQIATEAIASLSQTPATPMVQEGLREAATALIENLSSTYTARNGREVGIQGDDGEKCYIIHSDFVFDLRRALSATPAQEGER